MRRYLNLLNPKYLLSFPTFIITLLFSLLTHLVDTAHNVKGHIPVRVITIILIQIIFFAFMWLVNIVYQRVFKKILSPILVFILIILSGALRGFLLFQALSALNLENNLGLFFRMQTSVTNIGLALCVSTLSVAFISEHAASTNVMLRDQRRLIALRNEAVNQLAQFDEKLKDSIAGTLTKSIQDFASVRSDQALQMLRKSIDEVVRPLSNYLDRQTASLSDSEIQEIRYRINWKNVFDKSAYSEEISPRLILISLVIFGGAALSHDMPLKTALLEILSVLALGWILLWISKSVLAKFETSFSQTYRFIFSVVALYIPGQILGIESILVLHGTAKPRQFLFLIPVFTVLLGSLFAILRSARNEASQVRNNMESVASELKWELARAREINRQQQRLLTFTIHGQIQASMEASFIKLERAIATNSDTDELRRELVSLIGQSVDLLYRNYKDPEKLNSVLTKVRGTWEGISQVEWMIEKPVLDRVEEDAISHTALIDMITELVFNAVKHGKAKKITIELLNPDSRTIFLNVENDGAPITDQSRLGLGTKLLQESAISWQRVSKEGKVNTSALLPCL